MRLATCPSLLSPTTDERRHFHSSTRLRAAWQVKSRREEMGIGECYPEYSRQWREILDRGSPTAPYRTQNQYRRNARWLLELSDYPDAGWKKRLGAHLEGICKTDLAKSLFSLEEIKDLVWRTIGALTLVVGEDRLGQEEAVAIGSAVCSLVSEGWR